MTPLAQLDLLIKEIRYRDQVPYRLSIQRLNTPGHNTAGVRVSVQHLGTDLISAVDHGEDYNQAVQDCCSVLLANALRHALQHAKQAHDNERKKTTAENPAG